MALLSNSKIKELYGEEIKLSDVSGTVDGSNHMNLTVGDSVVLSDISYTQKGGNFICTKGTRKIGTREVVVQTTAWITEEGRVLNLGSMYKKDHLGNYSSANKGLPMSTANKADLLPLLFGGTIKVTGVEDIQVPRFGWKEGDEASQFVAAKRYTFEFTPKA